MLTVSISIVVILLIYVLYYRSCCNDHKYRRTQLQETIEKLQKEVNDKERQLANLTKTVAQIRKYNDYEDYLEKLRDDISNGLPEAIKKISSLWADIKILALEKDLAFLEINRKCRKASTYTVLRSNISKAKEYVRLYKEYKYKYETLQLTKSEEYKKLFDSELQKMESDKEALSQEIEALTLQKNSILQTIEDSKSLPIIAVQYKKEELSELTNRIERIKLSLEEFRSSELKKIRDREIESLQKITYKRKELEQWHQRALDLISQQIPEQIEKMAEFYADLKARIFDYYGDFLLSKSHPARDSAAYIKNEAKREIRETTKKWKEALYNYEYLKAQIEEKISDDVDFEEIESTTEEVKDSEEKWLSKEEYAKLSSIERSELALQQYIQRPKSKRQIGRDYEEFIAYLFRTQNGFSRCDIEMYGQLKGFDDLGRDIVVRNRDKLYIVQCKRWSKERYIRENAIMQLFGTVCEYCLEHRIDPMNALNKNVYAVFCATTQLSDTALRFAQILGIKFYQVEQGEYPRIKCNINNTTGEKIYHLPFDQQYNNIKIELNRGECMAMKVQEAEAKGFRRAKRHDFNQ